MSRTRRITIRRKEVKKEEMNLGKLTLVYLVMITFVTTGVIAVQPFGANLTFIDSERAPIDNASSIEALAGNVTEINIYGYSPTQTWQGYFGNVSGTVQLADANDNVLYNWSLASPEGEVYASRQGNTLDWTNVQCFNFTATGTEAGDEAATRGQTSLVGKNLTMLEAEYNITPDDVDGVDETFSLLGNHESGGALTHDLFYTNNLEFSAGECLSTHVFQTDGAVNGTVTDGEFQEVLLYEPSVDEVIFVAVLDEEDNTGFDGDFHDFQMLVLEDGHGTDVASTTYYFYVELE